MTPTQEKFTLSASLASIQIDWNNPGRGRYLRDAYWRANGGHPPTRRMVSPEIIETGLHIFKQLCRSHRHQSALGELMRQLFDADRLDQYKLRRAGTGRG